MAAAMRSLSLICLLTMEVNKNILHIFADSGSPLSVLTLLLCLMCSLLYVDVQLDVVRQTTFYFDAYTETNQCGKRTMRHSGIEFNAHLQS